MTPHSEHIENIHPPKRSVTDKQENEWQPGMRQGAHAELDDWQGDLALVGEINESHEALSLWFMPRLGEDTLDRGDPPYRLKNVALGADFHEDLRTQITAIALAAVAPLADTEVRGQVLDNRAALSERTRERTPLDWAATQGNLGNALQVLSEQQGSTAHLEEALVAYRAALDELPRKRIPLTWARTQNGLGAALSALGVQLDSMAHLEEAVVAYRAALSDRTRERSPFDWAATQKNLGDVLTDLGERQRNTARLQEAAEAYRAALQIFTAQRLPHYHSIVRCTLSTVLSKLQEQPAAPGSRTNQD